MADPKKFPVYLTVREIQYAKAVFQNPETNDVHEEANYRSLFNRFNQTLKEIHTPDAFKAISDAQRLSNLEEDIATLREKITGQAEWHDFRESDLLLVLLNWARRS